MKRSLRRTALDPLGLLKRSCFGWIVVVRGRVEGDGDRDGAGLRDFDLYEHRDATVRF